ncbi:histidine phosphatase family protein, partial [Rhodoferax sp. UBA5149]
MGAAHICVARHGETDWNRSGILQGWFDVPINEQGRRQARQLAA